MGDTFAVHEYMTTHQPKHAVIVGGGYIGLANESCLVRGAAKLLLRCKVIIGATHPTLFIE